MNFFMKSGPGIFTSNSINLGLLWIITLTTAAIGGYLGYVLGVKIFANPKLRTDLGLLKLLIRELKAMKRLERKTLALKESMKRKESLVG